MAEIFGEYFVSHKTSRIRTEMSGKEESPVESIPVEVLTRILDLLPFQDKLSSRLVCNYWRGILDTRRNYKFCAHINDNNLVDFLLNSCRDIEVVRLGNVTKEFPSMTFSRNRFPRIGNSVLQNNNSGPVVLNFLKYGSEFTETLEIQEYALENIDVGQISQVLTQVKWENLVQLELTIVMRTDEMKRSRKQLVTLTGFLQSVKIPHLRKLQVNLTNSSSLGDRGLLIREFCLNLYRFIAQHSETLKELIWILQTGAILEERLGCTIYGKIVELIRSNLRLESYTVRTQGRNTISTLPLASISSSSDCLISLSMEYTYLRNVTPELADLIEKVFHRNRMTLVNVAIRLPSFDMNWLKNCQKLQTLSIDIMVTDNGLTNMAADVSFPELTSFRLKAFFHNLPPNFDSWIVGRMKGIEKITLVTYRSFITVPVLKTLFEGLKRLTEIRVEKDIALSVSTVGVIQEFCEATEGFNFTILHASHKKSFITYVVKIDR